ncbi:MAG: hypothetical protein WAN65_27895 [Candidatus Sulfotelmatobacter sp.]
MAKKKTPKKKTRKNQAKLKKNSASKRKLAKKASGKKLVAKKTASKKRIAPKKAAAKTKSTAKKTQTVAAKSAPKKSIQRSPRVGDEQVSSMDSRTRSGGQSGDLQGLSDIDRADSESVDELLEEGNAFEAGIVEGVEEAGDREGSEVHTREVLEDDVPREYLDNEE